MRPGLPKLLVLFLGFTAFAVLLVCKLVSVQIVDHGYYKGIAEQQQGYLRPIPAKRGTVFDCNGRLLATSLPVYRVHADPHLIDSPKQVASSLGKVLSVNTTALARKLSNQGTYYVPIDMTLDLDRALQLKRLCLPGVYVEPSGKRVRPLGETGSNVIGSLSIFDEPLSGIEFTFDETLRGEPGLERRLRDAKGNPIPCLMPIVEMPVSGNSLILCMDVDLQTVAERALAGAVREHGARGGCVVVTAPYSGDILALASIPSKENLPVRTVFEPGSALKICTFSTGLDLGKIDSTQSFETEGGKIQIPGGWIKDDHPRGKSLNLRDAFKFSSNVAAVRIARKIGKDDFYRYLRAFGFGAKTGIQLGGESNGILREPEQWSKRSLETLAIGQEIGVTALQLAMAYGAIANGGTLMRPRLVKAVIDEKGNVKKRYPAKTVRRVIREKTATEMTKLLESVVQGGTGAPACMHGIHVAGKTGTGQKAASGRYIQGKYYSVFAGFVPAENPRYVCVVVIDEPSGKTIYGGPVCGPVFREVMDWALKRDKDVVPQGCVRLTRCEESVLTSVDAAVSAYSGISTGPSGLHGRDICAPVLGLTLREATRILERSGIEWNATGSGVVIRQDPPPRSAFSGKRACSLYLGSIR